MALSTKPLLGSAMALLCGACLAANASTPSSDIATPAQAPAQPPASRQALGLPELVARVKPSVVTILTYDADGQPARQGSGFFIAEDRIVTNLHVIQGANRAELRLTSGATFDIAGVLADDEGHDLALLQVDLSTNGSTLTIKPLRLADTIPKEGERIAVIGSPRGLEQTVSEGIVSAVREIPGFGAIIQMTAAISPGSSGSPVFNMRGEVIAVARSIVVDAQSINFAVAIEHVAAMQVGKLRRLNEVDRQATEGSDEALQELARGVAAYLANDYQEALVHFRRVIEINADDADGHFGLGAVYADLGRYREAIDAFKRTIRLKPDYAVAHYNLGANYGKLGRWQEAIDPFRQAVRIKPDYAVAHFNLGVVYGKLGREQEAIAACKQAIRLKPDLAEAHFYLGLAYATLNRYQEAIAALKQAIRVNPEVGQTHLSLGLAYRKLGRDQEAIDAFKQAIRIKPDYAKAHLNLGMEYAKVGRYQEAIDAYKQAIRIKPDDARAHFYLGLSAYAPLGRRHEAIAAYKQAIRIKPDYPDVHFYLGLAYLIVDDKGSALDEYKVLKELDRDLANKLFNLIYK